MAVEKKRSIAAVFPNVRRTVSRLPGGTMVGERDAVGGLVHRFERADRDRGEIGRMREGFAPMERPGAARRLA
jgi:hypothetical protein